MPLHLSQCPTLPNTGLDHDAVANKGGRPAFHGPSHLETPPETFCTRGLVGPQGVDNPASMDLQAKAADTVLDQRLARQLNGGIDRFLSWLEGMHSMDRIARLAL